MSKYDVSGNVDDAIDESIDEIPKSAGDISEELNEETASGETEVPVENGTEPTGQTENITVIYACHDQQKMEEGYTFPSQTFPQEHIEVFTVLEDDAAHPRKRSLEMVSQAKGTYLIMLDESDSFKPPLLALMIRNFSGTQTAFGMPSLVSLNESKNEAFFSVRNFPRTVKINTDYSQSVFPTDLHGLIFETKKLQEACQLYQRAAEPEKQILLHLLHQNPTFLYMGAIAIKYGEPRECDSRYDRRYKNKTWYFDPLEKFLLPALEKERAEHGSAGRLLQCLALYMLHTRLWAGDDQDDVCPLSSEERSAFTGLYQDVMQYVDEELIVSGDSNPTLAGFKTHLTDIRMKKKDASWYPEFKCSYDSVSFFYHGWKIGERKDAVVRVLDSKYEKGILELDGMVCNCFSDSQEKLYVRTAGEICFAEYTQDHGRSGCLTEDYVPERSFHAVLRIPFKNAKKDLGFGVCIGGMEYSLKHVLDFVQDDTAEEATEKKSNKERLWDAYDITVIYACHDQQKMEEGYELPKQTVNMNRVEVLPVFEDDVFWPRRRSMELIDQAQGRFVIMLDENDKFDKRLLQNMMEYFADSDTSFGMPSLIGQHVNRSTEYFSIKKMGKVAKIDTHYCQSVFPTELHGIIFETERLQEAYRQCASLVEPEKQIYLYLLNQNPNFLYIGARAIRYGQPRECDYQYDLRCQTREWYFDSLEKFLLPVLEKDCQENGRTGRLLQCLALHMLHVRIYANINNRNKHIVEPEEMDAYTKLYQDIMQYVDEATIFSTDSNPTSAALRNKLLDIRLKKRDFSWYPEIVCLPEGIHLMCDGMKIGQLSNLKARIYLIDYKKGSLEIDGEINDYFDAAHCDLYVKIQDKNYPVEYNQRFASTKCFGVTFSKMKTFHVSVKIPMDVTHRLMNFYLCIGGMEYQLDYEFVGHTSRFTRKYYNSYWYFDKFMAYCDKKGVHIKNRSRKLILIRELKLWKEIWKKKPEGYKKDLRLKAINFLLRPYFSKQKIWLFFDKIYKGGDSSEYMYKYAQAQKDGIKKYYLLDKSAADYKRMRKEGYQPLVRNSLKHRLMFLNANMVIASNSTVFAFNDYTAERSNLIRGDVHFDVACVQHGMSVQKIALAQQRLRDNTKLYFCASKYEIENLSKPVYDYQGYNALHLTGVPRYDGLKDRAEKVLLISPTWRMQAAMAVTKNEGVARDYNPNFKETNYYKVYNSLINDPRLIENVQKYGYRIKYVLHPIVSPQSEDFDKNEYVDIVPAIGDMSYEKVFCESALMVTDFSGVQFDFAYMRKPVVYLHHHDIPQHYEEGTYHYDTMSFGEICHTNDELIDVLIEYMKNDCKMPEMYRRRADDFFEYSDHNNCERIYKVMLEYENNR